MEARDVAELGSGPDERPPPPALDSWFLVVPDSWFLVLDCVESVGSCRRITSEQGEVLVNDLKAIAPYDEEAAKLVAALENFRQRERLDTASARDAVAVGIKKLIEASPLFQDKLEFPSFEESRLRVLVNQSVLLV